MSAAEPGLPSPAAAAPVAVRMTGVSKWFGAFQALRNIDLTVNRGEKIVVGVNRFEESDTTKADVFPIDEEQQRAQIARVRALKTTRDNDAVRGALTDLADAARGTQNVLYPMKTALSRMATLGEVADVLRAEFGVYTPN